jgi:hypothetical protein
MGYKLINDVKDDLNIVLYEILYNKSPKSQTLDQIEYVKEQLEKELEKEFSSEELDNYEAADIAETIKLIEDVLRIYRTEKNAMSSVKIRESTKIRLNKIAPTYDLAITKLLDEYEN